MTSSPMHYLLLVLLAPLLLGQCSTNKVIVHSPVQIGFYNVENLFDTLDDPLRDDDDFTPEGKQHWTADRYQRKLEHMADVITGMEMPDIMGFAEVENRLVLQDLVEMGSLRTQDYQIAHFDSPDHRGIDVALIYKSQRFHVVEGRPIHVDIQDLLVPGYTTRDILYCQLQATDGRILHVFVVHWPSRRDGPEVSLARRMQAARQLQAAIDEVRTQHPEGSLVILGDFNDEPTDQTLREVLRAGSRDESDMALFNAFWEFDRSDLGSYYYRGDWNMLDQAILSRNFLSEKADWQYTRSDIFKQNFMLYQDQKYGPLPNRTDGGTRYFGGYSDHLPVRIFIH